MELALQPSQGTSPIVRCDIADALPAFLAHVRTVIDAGDHFVWWVEREGSDPDIAFVIDKLGAAFRILRPGGEMAGMFAAFDDAIQYGAAMHEAVANAWREARC